MSRSDRVQRDLERAARRAKRLAERAEQRAERRAGKARIVAERAERLAERASRRSTRYVQDLDRSVEDLVDSVTAKWSRKAEEWIDNASGKMNDDLHDEVDGYSSSRRKARQAERQARRNRQAKSAGAYYSDDDPDQDQGKYRYSRFRRRIKRSRVRYRNKYGHGLYRNPDDRKVCGVCSGFADYFRVDTWKVRCGAVLGLVFIPQITITGYFIAYFLMDKKPYYRRVADRYQRTERGARTFEEPSSVNNEKSNDITKGKRPRMSNAQILRQAKSKFSEIESRLRDMESHVTSSTFELQRELKKISGDSSS